MVERAKPHPLAIDRDQSDATATSIQRRFRGIDETAWQGQLWECGEEISVGRLAVFACGGFILRQLPDATNLQN
jgi:hypothetical protein